MATFPEDIAVKDFFLNEVPKVFEEGAQKVKAEELAGTEFTVQFNITGEGGGNYALKITDGKNLEIVEGGVEKPNVLIELTEKNWREAITGKVPGVMDQMTNIEQFGGGKEQLNTIKNVSGVLNLELTRGDQEPYKIKMVFNGAETPSVSLKMSLDDYGKMIRKEVSGPDLFMSGKMSFEGDMTLLLQLQNVIGG